MTGGEKLPHNLTLNFIHFFLQGKKKSFVTLSQPGFASAYFATMYMPFFTFTGKILLLNRKEGISSPMFSLSSREIVVVSDIYHI